MPRDEWLCGYACALANHHRNYHDTSSVAETMRQDGFTIADFKRAGVEKYDLDELRRIWPSRRKPAASPPATKETK